MFDAFANFSHNIKAVNKEYYHSRLNCLADNSSGKSKIKI